MLEVLLSGLVLITAIPLAFIVASVTKDEKEIYKKYFPAVLWIIAVLTAIFYTLNIIVALTLTFMFIFIFFWSKSSKFLNKKKAKK